jgi:hypothetical protein
MFQKRFVLCTCAAVLAAAVACSKQSETPVSPGSSSVDAGSPAAPDGSTLKVTAPTPVSPVNNAQPDSLELVATQSAGKFVSVPLLYEFEIFNAANTRVYASGATAGTLSGNNVSHIPSGASLTFDAPHTWRVRAVYQGAVGPWSATASFRAPVGGYQRGTELFDPLTNGPSPLMTASNDVTWLPGVGVRLNSKESYVQWTFATPCTDCEFSAFMTNIGNGSEEWKTKVMSMMRGNGVNITDNPYRVTLDKRTAWAEQGSRIRYTMVSHNVANEPAGGPQNWNRTFTYFWNFEWRNGTSRLRVMEGGRNGRQMENLSARYAGPYDPTPHILRLGSVGGRAGSDTNPGTIVWNVWFSPNARPNLPGDK